MTPLKTSFLLTVLVFLLAGSLSAQSFTLETGFNLPGIIYGCLEWGDYDNDGDLDLFFCGEGEGGNLAKIYSNNGNGSFTEQSDITLQVLSAVSAAWVDYNNDGDLDLYLSGTIGFEKHRILYKNEGNNNFVEQTSISIPALDDEDLQWGDYDNDGDADVLVCGNSVNEGLLTKIYKNNGDNSFTAQSGIALKNVYNGSVDWSDYDRDGDLDIVLTGATSFNKSAYDPVTLVYRNNGDNSFSEQSSFNLAGVRKGFARWGDYDNDAYPDLLVSGYLESGSYFTGIYRNNEGESFTLQSQFSFPDIFPTSAEWGDYNNNGYLDILISGQYKVKVYQNNGGNGFTELTDFDSGRLYYSTMAWGDYDGDDDLDLIISGYSGSFRTELYKNNAASENTLPTVPANQQVLLQGSSASLSWDHASDAESPQNGLSYNVMVGTAPNGIDISSPMADIVTGRRRIVARGNILDNNWTLRHLATGTYYWKVQAIDGSGAGSGFSAGGSFSISFNNSIAPTDHQSLLPDTPGTTLTVSETQAAGNRQWKYSSTQGGPYQYDIPGATGTSYTPDFAEFGSYYVICVSERNGAYVSSNEVRIEIPLFSPQNQYELGSSSISAGKWGDFDSDGDLDILVVDMYESHIYSNNGELGFSEQTETVSGGFMNSNIAINDYEGDGDLDILIAGGAGLGGSGANTIICLNNGDKSFTCQTDILLPGVQDASLIWEDTDGDGDPDILLSGTDSYGQLICRLLRKDSEGLFTELNPDIVPFEGMMKAGDYDNDGFIDILLSGRDYSGNYVSKIYRNKGDNTFEERKDIDLGRVTGSVDWGDFDNDGDLDILLVGQEIQNMISMPVARVYLNQGKHVFTAMENTGLLGVSWGALASWIDIDNDGDLDVFINGYTKLYGYISRFFVNTGEEFTEIIPPGIPVLHQERGNYSWVDYDGDKDLDLHLFGSSTQEAYFSRIYRNNSRTINNAPGVPANPISENLAGGARLSWDRPPDAETPSKGLTYNVSISKSKYGSDVLAPMSDLLSGYRKIPHIGNAYLSPEHSIAGLDTGTYYWQVQSLDPNFQGSSFTPVDSFSVLPPFTENDIGLNDVEHVTARPGDYNADGNMDILISGDSAQQHPSTIIYVNEGDSYFVAVETGMTDIGDGTSSWWDYNNDGLLDVLVAGTSSEPGEGYGLKLYRNMGDGSFSLHTTFESIFDSYITLATGDLNNDGLEDLITHELNGRTYAKIYKNNGDETFTNIGQEQVPNLDIGALALGDYDNDMDLDLLIAGGSDLDGEIVSKVYRNDDNFHFTNILADLPGFWESNVSWADYDNDGDLDILLAGTDQYYNKYTRLYRNDGGDVFTESPAQIRGSRNGSLHWGDFDQDGDSDILYAGSSGTYFTSIYRNDGNDRFTEVGFGHPLIPGTVSWFDFDNDRDLDILCAGGVYWQIKTTAFRNNGNRNNERPSIPTGLLADGSGYGAMFSWDASSDDQTPSQALSYNIRVGTVSGGQDLIAPKSHIVTGKLHVPALGNCQLNTGWRIDSLPVGTYYWSVQAVDNTYVGGEWAPEQSFSVTILNSSFSADTVCAGSETQFTDLSISSGSPISGWSWDFGDGNSSAQQNPVHTYAEAGSYEVELVINNGESADTLVKSILVRSLPLQPAIITENYDPDECPSEDPVLLYLETPETETSYHWMLGATDIPGADKDSLTGFLTEGDYRLVASRDGCTAESDLLTINYPFVPDKPTIHVGGPVVWYLACSNGNATSYRWYYKQTLIPGANDYIYVPGDKMGLYEVSIAQNSNCYISSDPVRIPLGTGIEDDIWKDLKIYPNPTPGLFTLEMNNPVMGELMIDIVNESGARIIHITFLKESSHFRTEIDLSSQPSAVYLIALILEEYRATRKLIVE